MSEQEYIFRKDLLDPRRKKLHLSVRDVVKYCGSSVTAWNDWRDGKYVPKSSKLQKLCEILQFQEEDLITSTSVNGPLNKGEKKTLKKITNEALAGILYIHKFEDVLSESSHVLDIDQVLSLKTALAGLEMELWQITKKYLVTKEELTRKG